MTFELFVVCAVLTVGALIYFEQSRFYEAYRLTKLVKLTNRFYGTEITTPGTVVTQGGSTLVGEPVDDLTITKFIQSVTCAASVGELGVLRTNLFETHREFLKLNPKAIELHYGNDAGCWNTITYTYTHHTVRFYISLE